MLFVDLQGSYDIAPAIGAAHMLRKQRAVNPISFTAFTDHHGSVDSINNVIKLAKDSRSKFIVCAGDFTVFCEGLHPSLKMLADSGIPVYFIAGNHEHDGLCRQVERAFKTFRYVGLQLETICLADGRKFQIAGIDGLNELSPHDGEDESVFDTFNRVFEARMDGALPLILLTHFPPTDTACCGREPVFKGDLCVGCKEGPALGSRVVRRIVETLKPHTVVCGHFHDRFNEADLIDETIVINPGPDGSVLGIRPRP